MTHSRPSTITFAGGCICPPAPHKSIRMDLMKVTMFLKPNSYIVNAVFHLFNTGTTTKEWVGVPKHGKVNEPARDGSPPKVRDFIRFDSWVDGRKAVFPEERDFLRGPVRLYPKRNPGTIPMEETKWMVKQVTFSARAVTIIRIRYEAQYYDFIGSRANDFAYYFFGTSLYWKGNIRKAIFTVDSADTCGRTIGMRFHADLGGRIVRKKITKNIQRFEVRNFAPPFRTEVLFGPGNRIVPFD
jgi:hypothetical protein